MNKQILKISVILLTVLFAFQSCRKEIYDPGLSVDGDLPAIVQQAQVWVNEHSFRSRGATVDYSQLDFDWKAYGIKKNHQGQDVVYIPVANRYQEGREYMELAFVAAEKVGTLKHYVGDFASEFIQLNFYAVDGKQALSGSFSTKTGKMKTRIALSSKNVKLQKIASTSSNSSGAEGNMTDGFIIDEVVVPPPNNPFPPIIVDPPSGGGSPPPPPPGNGGVSTPPYGGGGYTPPYTGGSNSQTNYIDPCVTAKKIEKALNDPIVKQKNEILREKVDYEYAFTHQLNLNNNIITTSDIYSNDPPSPYTISFKWTPYDASTNFIYTGASHNHPGIEPPSLTDLYSFNGYYNTLPKDIRKTFVENHSQTIITTNQDYVVSIRDEAQWNTKAQEYTQGRKDDKENIDSEARKSYNKQKADYSKYLREYSSDDGTYEKMHEYALFKSAGEYMNFYTVNAENATIKVEPYIIDTNGNKVKINCNN